MMRRLVVVAEDFDGDGETTRATSPRLHAPCTRVSTRRSTGNAYRAVPTAWSFDAVFGPNDKPIMLPEAAEHHNDMLEEYCAALDE